MTEEEIIAQIPRRKIKALVNDPAKSAEAVNLVYVSDQEPGIERVKRGDKFEFRFNKKKITDTETHIRIKSLAIPPAWQKVWICARHDGHLQATGIDARGRKQYKYHTDWVALRNHTKYYRLYQFGQVLPAIRQRVKQDLALPGLQLNKVLATVVSLMEQTNIRIGNDAYEKIYGSYGITTLKDKHVTIKGSSIQFEFRGKKGIYHNISISSRKLAKIVKHCQDIPGKELFQYRDDDGNRKPIDSGMVNEYIREISGGDFTAKDFRTWAGTVKAFHTLATMGCCDTESGTKKNILATLDEVAQLLGNTRTVCRKYYVHPRVLTLYETRELEKFIKQVEKEKDDDETGLNKEEKILMKILSQ